MPIDLYYQSFSIPCRAVLMTAKELNIDYNLKLMDITAGDHLVPEFLKINPQHIIPTIDDDGFVLWESRAISSYLANKYATSDSLYPKAPEPRAIVDRMLYFDMGTLYRAFADFFYPQVMNGESPKEEKERRLYDALEFLNAYLDKYKYAAGEYLTIADLSLVATVSTIEVSGVDFSLFSNILPWLETLKLELPYFKEVNYEGLEQFRKWTENLQNDD